MPWRKYTPKAGKFGPIYQTAKGVQVRCDRRGKWTLFVEREGERKNKTIGAGRDALVKAIKAAETVAAGLKKVAQNLSVQPPRPKTPRFQDYSLRWLERNSGRWSTYTQDRYEGILRLHIWPHPIFKGRALDEIERQAIKDFLSHLLKSHAAATVELAHIVLCGIFEEAVDDEILKANPAHKLQKRVLPPKDQRRLTDPDPFTYEERDRFLHRAKKGCSWAEELILRVMVFMGLRLGEALAMRLGNLDSERMTYQVTESYKQYRFGRPKRGRKRSVDIPEFLADELRAYVLHLRKENFKRGLGGKVDLLFRDPAEKGSWPYSQRKVQALVRRVCVGAGLRVRNPHDLRHTYATLLLMAHQSPVYVQRQLGHKSIRTTVDLYGHPIPGEGRHGLEDALLGFVQNPGENRI